jgi:hypothetical protein
VWNWGLWQAPQSSIGLGVKHRRPRKSGIQGLGQAAEADWAHLVVFGMQNRTFGPYLAAISRTPIPLIALSFSGRTWTASIRQGMDTFQPLGAAVAYCPKPVMGSVYQARSALWYRVFRVEGLKR